MLFISLVCFTPFEENEDGCRKPRYSWQSLTQSPADQKARANVSEQAFFFQVHTTECGLGAGALA